MPRGDGTGPLGMGPMTGRGAGYCAGYTVPGFMNPAWGRGMGMAWGRGGGGGMAMAWRRGRGGFGGARFAAAVPGPAAYGPAYGPPTREQQLSTLRGQAEWLKEQLDSITARIGELEREEQ
jgi:hypothetical protein